MLIGLDPGHVIHARANYPPRASGLRLGDMMICRDMGERKRSSAAKAAHLCHQLDASSKCWNMYECHLESYKYDYSFGADLARGRSFPAGLSSQSLRDLDSIEILVWTINFANAS